MIISRIPVPEDTWLVEIVTDKNNHLNHTVHFLNKYGNLVENPVKIWEATFGEVNLLIHHMMKIHFTSDITETIPNINKVFNRIDGNCVVDYDSLWDWQLNPQVVPVIREYCKLENVLMYEDTLEFKEKAHIIKDFILQGNNLETVEILKQAVV